MRQTPHPLHAPADQSDLSSANDSALADKRGLDAGGEFLYGDGAAPNLLAQLLAIRQRAPALTLSQLMTFLHVGENEGMRVKDLARHADDSEANISRNVRALTGPEYGGSLGHAYGFLTLLRNAQDARTRHVVLSSEGRALYARLTARDEGSISPSSC